MKQLHIYFSGNVQGVGFRQNTCRLARGFQVTGWVKNLSDGRVELLVEGEEPQIGDFVKLLCERMKNYIQETAVVRKEATGQYHDFDITYE